MALLMTMAAAGELPGYSASGNGDSFWQEAPAMAMEEYFSGENDALERRLKALWAGDSRLSKCIPVILAAVEKSRGRERHELVYTELYNYTM